MVRRQNTKRRESVGSTASQIQPAGYANLIHTVALLPCRGRSASLAQPQRSEGPTKYDGLLDKGDLCCASGGFTTKVSLKKCRLRSTTTAHFGRSNEHMQSLFRSGGKARCTLTWRVNAAAIAPHSVAPLSTCMLHGCKHQQSVATGKKGVRGRSVETLRAEPSCSGAKSSSDPSAPPWKRDRQQKQS